MKSIFLKFVFLSLFLVVVINGDFCDAAHMEKINWVKNYDEGLEIAKKSNKNLFVLITAPSWCYYCKVFENGVLSKSEIQTILNDDFVPVLVLDKVDGRRNPDLARFAFPGFPSVYLYDKDGVRVKDISTSDPSKMLWVLREYADVAGNKASIEGKDNIENGELTSTSKNKIDDFMNAWVRE